MNKGRKGHEKECSTTDEQGMLGKNAQQRNEKGVAKLVNNSTFSKALTCRAQSAMKASTSKPSQLALQTCTMKYTTHDANVDQSLRLGNLTCHTKIRLQSTKPSVHNSKSTRTNTTCINTTQHNADSLLPKSSSLLEVPVCCCGV